MISMDEAAAMTYSHFLLRVDSWLSAFRLFTFVEYAPSSCSTVKEDNGNGGYFLLRFIRLNAMPNSVISAK